MSPRNERPVGEVMLLLEEYATVAADATVEDALIALDKAQLGLTYDRHHHRAVLVLEHDAWVGADTPGIEVQPAYEWLLAGR